MVTSCSLLVIADGANVGSKFAEWQGFMESIIRVDSRRGRLLCELPFSDEQSPLDEAAL